ncbi:MAG: VOC family protein [Actinomycetota bacterium]|nr:VOC family protein [Actinomycetota bacterium]
MTRTGLIDHIGIGVPDLAAAKELYDELMAIVGMREWFPGTTGEFNYGPDGAVGAQLFFSQALEPAEYSRHRPGLQHLSFMVEGREIVDEAHRWTVDRRLEVVHAPRELPEYGDHDAAYVLDPHRIMLEVVCHDGA